MEVVTLAVYLLGGDHHVVDTEDIAVKANELAPGRFTWHRYHDQINLELIRVFLSDAKKKANGAMIAGSGRTGWTLTLKGLEWVQGRGEALIGSDMRVARENKRAAAFNEVRWRRERARILATPAWSKWASGDRNVSEQEAAEVFRIDAYAHGRIRDLKVGRLREMFKDDTEIRPFIENAARAVQQREGIQ